MPGRGSSRLTKWLPGATEDPERKPSRLDKWLGGESAARSLPTPSSPPVEQAPPIELPRPKPGEPVALPGYMRKWAKKRELPLPPQPPEPEPKGLLETTLTELPGALISMLPFILEKMPEIGEELMDPSGKHPWQRTFGHITGEIGSTIASLKGLPLVLGARAAEVAGLGRRPGQAAETVSGGLKTLGKEGATLAAFKYLPKLGAAGKAARWGLVGVPAYRGARDAMIGVAERGGTAEEITRAGIENGLDDVAAFAVAGKLMDAERRLTAPRPQELIAQGPEQAEPFYPHTGRPLAPPPPPLAPPPPKKTGDRTVGREFVLPVPTTPAPAVHGRTARPLGRLMRAYRTAKGVQTEREVTRGRALEAQLAAGRLTGEQPIAPPPQPKPAPKPPAPLASVREILQASGGRIEALRTQRGNLEKIAQSAAGTQEGRAARGLLDQLAESRKLVAKRLAGGETGELEKQRAWLAMTPAERAQLTGIPQPTAEPLPKPPAPPAKAKPAPRVSKKEMARRKAELKAAEDRQRQLTIYDEQKALDEAAQQERKAREALKQVEPAPTGLPKAPRPKPGTRPPSLNVPKPGLGEIIPGAKQEQQPIQKPAYRAPKRGGIAAFAQTLPREPEPVSPPPSAPPAKRDIAKVTLKPPKPAAPELPAAKPSGPNMNSITVLRGEATKRGIAIEGKDALQLRKQIHSYDKKHPAEFGPEQASKQPPGIMGPAGGGLAGEPLPGWQERARIEKLRPAIDKRIERNKVSPDVVSQVALRASRERVNTLDAMTSRELGAFDKELSKAIRGPRATTTSPRGLRQIHAVKAERKIDDDGFRNMVFEVTGGVTDSAANLSPTQQKQLVARMKGAPAPWTQRRPPATGESAEWQARMEAAPREVRAKHGVKYPDQPGVSGKGTLWQRVKSSGPWQVLFGNQEDHLTRVQRVAGEKGVVYDTQVTGLRKGQGATQAIYNATQRAFVKTKDRAGISDKKLVRYEGKRTDIMLPSGKRLKISAAEAATIALMSRDPQARAAMIDDGVAFHGAPTRVKLTPADVRAMQRWVSENTRLDPVLDHTFSWMNTEGSKLARQGRWRELGEDLEVTGHYVPLRRLASKARETRTMALSPPALEAKYKAAAAGYKGGKSGKGYQERGGPREPALRGMSPFRERTQTKAPVLIDSVFDMIETHVGRISAYSGKAVPIQRAREMLYDEAFRKSVRESFADGERVLNAMDYYIKQVEGLEVNRSQSAERMFGRALKRFQQGVLGLKPHIALYQPVSYLNAVAEIPTRHLLGALKTRDAGLASEIERYAPEIDARIKGSTHMLLSPAMSPNRRDVTHDFWGVKRGLGERGAYYLIREADAQTIKTIFQASKLWAKADGFKGEAMLKEAARRAQVAVDRTQPTWDPLTMSLNQLEGRQRPVLKAVMMFTAQPNKNLNMAIRSLDSWYSGNKSTPAMLRDVTVPLIVNPFLVYAIGQGAQAAYGRTIKRDPVDHVIGLLERSLGGWIYGVKLEQAIRESVERAVGNKKWADVSDDPTEALKAMGAIIDTVHALIEDERYTRGPHFGDPKAKRKAMEALLSTLTAVSRLTGAPLEGPVQIAKPRLLPPALPQR